MISINIGLVSNEQLAELVDRLEAVGIDDYELTYANDRTADILFSFPADRNTDAIDALQQTNGLIKTMNDSMIWGLKETPWDDICKNYRGAHRKGERRYETSNGLICGLKIDKETLKCVPIGHGKRERFLHSIDKGEIEAMVTPATKAEEYAILLLCDNTIDYLKECPVGERLSGFKSLGRCPLEMVYVLDSGEIRETGAAYAAADLQAFSNEKVAEYLNAGLGPWSLDQGEKAAEIPDCTTGEQAIGGVPDMTGDTGMDIGDLEM